MSALAVNAGNRVDIILAESTELMNSPARGSPHREFVRARLIACLAKKQGGRRRGHNPYNVVQHCERRSRGAGHGVQIPPSTRTGCGGIDLERARKARADVLAELRAADLRRAEQSVEHGGQRPDSPSNMSKQRRRQPERERGA